MDPKDDGYILRMAGDADKETIWQILQQAIERRKKDGSEQWQNGYPNLGTVTADIQNKAGFVLVKNEEIAAYTALIFDTEPAYETIEGAWLTTGKYAVVHRVAVSEKFIGQGIAAKLFFKIEDLVKSKRIPSIKVDTNFDNIPMLKILEKLQYTYCGEVYLQGSPRKAFEKIIS